MFVANKIYMISLSKKCTLLLLSCFLLQTISCSNKKENPVYEQPKPIKRDATFTWIDEASNADKPNYMAVFYSYYHQLIKENKWEDAADVLNAACRNNSRINSFDNTFITTINTFVRQYRAKLPVAKTLFINSYFSDFYKNKGNYKIVLDT
jgi:hypothetical protein